MALAGLVFQHSQSTPCEMPCSALGCVRPQKEAPAKPEEASSHVLSRSPGNAEAGHSTGTQALRPSSSPEGLGLDVPVMTAVAKANVICYH